jgi:antitoxin (DNA-binding transcriptional repressor) of toxin-antitoxin stability system
MKKVGITEAKNRLSALLDGVKNGVPVLIVDRGKPVARLDAVAGDTGVPDGRLQRLVRAGIARPATGTLPKTFLNAKLPRVKSNAVAALLEERREGR